MAKSKAAAEKQSSKNSSTPPRRHTRFTPDAGAYAKIDLKPSGEFEPTMVGLVAEEAFGGCGLVVINTADLQGKLKVGDKLQVQVGRLDPMVSEVRWRVDLDPKTVRLGLMYCE